jgi:sugar phosphate permease
VQAQKDGRVKKQPFFYGWWVVLSCVFISLWAGGVVYGMSAFFNPIVEEFRWTYLVVSLAGSLLAVELGILAPIAGFLTDRFGPRKVIFCSALLSGTGLLLLSRIHTLVVFYIAFGILSMGLSGFGQVVTTTAVANWFDKKVGRATGFSIAGYGAGGILMPLIVWLIAHCGWRMSFAILGVATCIILLPASLLLRHKPEQYGYLPDGEMSDRLETTQNETEGIGSGKIAFNVIHVLRTKTFWLLGFTLTIQLMVYNTMIVHIMPCFSSMGLPRSRAAFVAMFIPLSSIVGRLSFGWLGDLFDKRYLLVMCLLLETVGLAFLSYAGALWHLVAFLVFFGPALGGTGALRSIILREHFGRQTLGSIQGLTAALMTIGAIVGPAYAGWVFDVREGYQIVWLTFTGAILAGIPSILAIRKSTEKQWEIKNGPGEKALIGHDFEGANP